MVERFSPFAVPHRSRLGRVANGRANASLCQFCPPLPPVLLVDPNSCFILDCFSCGSKEIFTRRTGGKGGESRSDGTIRRSVSWVRGRMNSCWYEPKAAGYGLPSRSAVGWDAGKCAGVAHACIECVAESDRACWTLRARSLRFERAGTPGARDAFTRSLTCLSSMSERGIAVDGGVHSRLSARSPASVSLRRVSSGPVLISRTTLS